jgi:hypothetical protein
MMFFALKIVWGFPQMIFCNVIPLNIPDLNPACLLFGFGKNEDASSVHLSPLKDAPYTMTGHHRAGPIPLPEQWYETAKPENLQSISCC